MLAKMAGSWFEKAPRAGSADEFAALRDLLAGAGYCEEGIRQLLAAQDLSRYQKPPWSVLRRQPVSGALDVLVRLFFHCVYVEQAALEQWLPTAGLAALESLHLLAGEGPRYATAGIVPVGPWLTLCDRVETPEGTPCELPDDVVYPAGTEHSREFQGILPQTPCEALLDIGTGTGIAALAASRYAAQVWGTDIAARSVRFADFNCRLNGVENVTLALGDLYGPVEGLTFDRIVTHPPYVPARRNSVIFRDAGEDGEQILRRIVEGLPQFLRPGGRFYTLVTAADCEGQAFEDRIRAWLGEAEREFDLVLISHTLTTPKDLVANMLAKRNTAMEDVLYRQELWERRKVQFLFYGTVLARRHGEARPAFTARVQKGEGYAAKHAEWLMNWHSRAGDTARLLNCRPAISPGAELAVFHHVREGRLAADGYSLRAPGPFDTECIVQPWLAKIVAQCDGRTSWGELMESARRSGMIDPGTTAEEFASVLVAIAGSGLLRVQEAPLD